MKRYAIPVISAMLMLTAVCCSTRASKNYVIIDIDLDEKEADVTGTPGLRETIDVRLTNTLTYASEDMRFYIIGKTNAVNLIVAQCTNFTDQTGYFDGELNLNTIQLTNQFANMQDQGERSFTMILVDVTANDTLVNDIIDIQNNPYSAGMGTATTVSAALAVNYALVANGVTGGDSHNHDGGDGAQIDHTTLSNVGTNTHAEIDARLDAIIASSGDLTAITNVTDALGTIANSTGTIPGVGTTAAEINAAVSLQNLQGAVTDAQVPDGITVSNYLPLAGGTMAGNIDGGNNRTTNILVVGANRIWFTDPDGAGWDADQPEVYWDTISQELTIGLTGASAGNTITIGINGMTFDVGGEVAVVATTNEWTFRSDIVVTNSAGDTYCLISPERIEFGTASFKLGSTGALSADWGIGGKSLTNATSYGLSNGVSFGIAEYNHLTNAYSWGDHAEVGYLTGAADSFWQITAANTSATYLATTVVSNGTFTGSGAGWATTSGVYTANTMLCPFGSTTTLTQSNRMAVLTGRIYRVTADLNVSATGSGEGVLIALGGETNTWDTGDDRTIHHEYLIRANEGLRIEMTPTNDAVYLDNVTCQLVEEGDGRFADDVHVGGVIWLAGTNIEDLIDAVTYSQLQNWAGHPAVSNVQLNGHWLSGDGGDEGIWISPSGHVGICTNAIPSEIEPGSGWGYAPSLIVGRPIGGKVASLAIRNDLDEQAMELLFWDAFDDDYWAVAAFTDGGGNYLAIQRSTNSFAFADFVRWYENGDTDVRDHAVTNLDDEAYTSAGFDGDKSAVSKNAVRDEMELRAVKSVVDTQKWDSAQISDFPTNTPTAGQVPKYNATDGRWYGADDIGASYSDCTNTYYVMPCGNDADSGLNIMEPKLTIAAALAAGAAVKAAGGASSTVLVYPGTYAEDLIISNGVSLVGYSANNTVILGSITIDAGYLGGEVADISIQAISNVGMQYTAPKALDTGWEITLRNVAFVETSMTNFTDTAIQILGGRVRMVGCSLVASSPNFDYMGTSSGSWLLITNSPYFQMRNCSVTISDMANTNVGITVIGDYSTGTGKTDIRNCVCDTTYTNDSQGDFKFYGAYSSSESKAIAECRITVNGIDDSGGDVDGVYAENGATVRVSKVTCILDVDAFEKTHAYHADGTGTVINASLSDDKTSDGNEEFAGSVITFTGSPQPGLHTADAYMLDDVIITSWPESPTLTGHNGTNWDNFCESKNAVLTADPVYNNLTDVADGSSRSIQDSDGYLMGITFTFDGWERVAGDGEDVAGTLFPKLVVKSMARTVVGATGTVAITGLDVGETYIMDILGSARDAGKGCTNMTYWTDISTSTGTVATVDNTSTLVVLTNVATSSSMTLYCKGTVPTDRAFLNAIRMRGPVGEGLDDKYMRLDGQEAMTGDLPMGGYDLTDAGTLEGTSTNSTHLGGTAASGIIHADGSVAMAADLDGGTKYLKNWKRLYYNDTNSYFSAEYGTYVLNGDIVFNGGNHLLKDDSGIWDSEGTATSTTEIVNYTCLTNKAATEGWAGVTNNQTGLTLDGDFTSTGTLDGYEGAEFCLVAGDTITGALLLDDDANMRMDATADGMADDKFNGTTMTGKLTGEAVTQWQAVYLWTNGTWKVADADLAGAFPSWGIATATIGTGTNLVVLTQGIVRNDAWTWTTNGAPLYLSDTAGGLSQTPPGTAADCVQLIGKVLSDDEAYINAGSMVYGLVK